ncbi:MAG: fimbrillin family protein [Candidatus Cryptobacteroides sp.]
MDYRNIYAFVAVLAAALSLASCDRQDVTEQCGMPIGFGSAAGEILEASTKSGAGEGVVKSTTETMRSKPFGIFGLYSQDEGSADGTNVFLSSNAMEVLYDGDSWEYSPIAYWSINRHYRFRAWHPYSGSAFTVLNSSNVDLVSIDYKIATGNEDLMFAFWKGKADESVISDRVPMYFNHALSALRFRIGMKDSGDISDDYTDEVTSFWLTGLIPNGTVLYTYPSDNYAAERLEWIANNYDSSTIYYEWSGSKSFSKIHSDDCSDATMIFDGDDNMAFAIPQVSSGGETPTTAHFRTQKGGDAVHSVLLPSVEWKPGVIYTYTFVVSQSKIEVKITIKDWEIVEVNEDIHIL